MKGILDRCKRKAIEKETRKRVRNISGRGREGEKRFDRSGRNFHRNWQKISKTRRQWRTHNVEGEGGGREEERGKRENEKEAIARKRSNARETARAACRYSMPIHIQPGVERHEANRK